MKFFDLFRRSQLGGGYRFPHKDDFPHQEIADRRAWILRYIRPEAVGAEFGVFRGHFSEVILRNTTATKLYSVDPWTKYGERYNWGTENTPYTNYNALTTAEAKADATHRLHTYGDRSDMREEFENDFCRSFKGKLDFVYLDSSHYYKDTMVTLALIDTILADDGVVMGDDWYDDPAHYSGVCRGVNEFVKMFNYEIVIAGQDTQYCIRRTARYSHAAQQPLAPMSLAAVLKAGQFS